MQVGSHKAEFLVKYKKTPVQSLTLGHPRGWVLKDGFDLQVAVVGFTLIFRLSIPMRVGSNE